MFGIRFIKAQPTVYMLQFCKGRVIREGVGLTFFYYAPTISLVAVPAASAESPFIFEEVTADFQSVTIQGQVTYRVADPKRLAALMNFTLDARGQGYVSEDPQKLPQRVINVVNVLARAELQRLPLREALRAADTLVQAVRKGLVGSAEIAQLGIEILGLSILAIKPTPETARALEAEAREQLLKEADEAKTATARPMEEEIVNDQVESSEESSEISASDAEPRKLHKRHRMAFMSRRGR